MKLDFHFGHKKTTHFQYAMVGLGLDILEYLLTRLTKITHDDFMTLIDNLNREVLNNRILNDYIIQDNEWLSNRIENDIDSAIDDYLELTGQTEEVIIEPPTFTEELDGATLLGGEMRLTAPYHKNNEL